MSQYAIEINGLCKTYKGNDYPSVNRLSVQVEQGDIFGLLGPNGAGKTTTIGILCGLRSYNAGEVMVCGYSLKTDLPKIKSIIGFVPQEIALYPTLTAAENLKVFGGIFEIEKHELNQRIDSLLELFGLTNHKHRLVGKYSGGMKRRINLIAGLLHKPQVLFLDEPTVGIDVQSKNMILENLREINRQGTTIIYTSHYMDEAEQLCNRLAFIDEGRIIAQGNPKELIAQTPDCFTLEQLYLQLTGKKLRD